MEQRGGGESGSLPPNRQNSLDGEEGLKRRIRWDAFLFCETPCFALPDSAASPVNHLGVR